MIKRLSLSVMLLAMAAFAMTGAATAFWTTSESGAVSITSGNADLDVAVAVNCSGPYEDPGENPQLAWNNIYPGLTTSDCFQVTNLGDAPLDVTLRFANTSGNSLLSALEFKYRSNTSNGSADGGFRPNGNTWSNGKPVGTLQPGDSTTFRVNAQFNSDGNQNSLQNRNAGFTAVIDGVTP